MLRITLVLALSGHAAASLADECITGLQQLQGGSDDVELMMRCRSAFGPQACKQARQSLGAQPWTRARMEGSCQRLGAAYTGDSRTLEDAVAAETIVGASATQTNVDSTAVAKPPAPTIDVPAAPVQQPQEPEGPEASAVAAQGDGNGEVDRLVAGLMEKEWEDRKAHGAQAKQAEVASADEKKHAEGHVPGPANKIKGAKEAGEAEASAAATQGDGNRKVHRLVAGLMEKVWEDRKAHEAQAKQAGVASADEKKLAEGPLAGLMNKVEEAKAEHDSKAGAVESDQQGPLAKMFKHMEVGKKAPVLKLYDDARIEEPAGANHMAHMMAAFSGAASLVAVTLLVTSRRLAATTHQQLGEQLDSEIGHAEQETE